MARRTPPRPHPAPALDPWGEAARLAVVGRPLARREGPDKVAGRVRYAADVRLAGQLQARVLRSPHPHARVLRVDTARALALPGVHAVLSCVDAPDIAWHDGQTRLFDRTLRFVGDEVAAVAADSGELAVDALALIDVEYEPLPFVTDARAALAADAPAVHAAGNLAAEPSRYRRGDVDAALAAAACVIEAAYVTPTAVHNALEAHGCTAHWNDGTLTLHESTQGICEVRAGVAAAMNLPEARVRVICKHMGGGFGAKQIAWKHSVIAALLAQRTARPVTLMLDRRAENLASGNRNATHQQVRLAAAADGSLLAIEADIIAATGAYLVGGEESKVGGPYQTLYACPNVRTEQRTVHTHTGPAVAFRAPGFVEGTFALESAMDELARALDMDPLSLRLRNLAGHDQRKGRPYSLPEALRGCCEHAAAAFRWHEREGAREHPPGARRRGFGFAAHNWMGGAGFPPASVRVRFGTDGHAAVLTGTQDIGTGTRTALLQIAAEELGLPPAAITLVLGDTGSGQQAPPSAGSATLATLGPCVRTAAAEARRKLCAAAAARFKVPAARVKLRDGQVQLSARPRRTVSVAEVCAALAPATVEALAERGKNPSDVTIQTCGAQCAEVEVDLATGEITVLRVAASHDCGRVINPLLTESQVIGGIMQGLGFALMEERVLDAATGRVLNANLEDYRVPTLADCPVIVHAPLDLPDLRANVTGAKGIGEPPIVPHGASNRERRDTADAIGVRIRELPLTRARVLAALAGRSA